MQNTEIFVRLIDYITGHHPTLKGEGADTSVVFEVSYKTFNEDDLETMAQHFGFKVGDYGDDIVPLSDPENNFMYAYLLGKKLHIYRDPDMRKHYS